MKRLPCVAFAVLLGSACSSGEPRPAGGQGETTPASPLKPAAAQTLAELIAEADACPPEEVNCEAQQNLLKRVNATRPSREDLVAGLAAARTLEAQGTLVRALARTMDDSLLPTLEPFLTSPDQSLRRGAHQTMAVKGSEAALARLAALLDNHDQTDTLHGDIPEILARYPTSAVSKAALPKLKTMASEDRQGPGRTEACKAIAAIAGEEGIAFLAERAAKETFPPTRAAIARELGKFAKNPAAQAALKKLTADSDPGVQSAAKKALGQ